MIWKPESIFLPRETRHLCLEHDKDAFSPSRLVGMGYLGGMANLDKENFIGSCQEYNNKNVERSNQQFSIDWGRLAKSFTWGIRTLKSTILLWLGKQLCLLIISLLIHLPVRSLTDSSSINAINMFHKLNFSDSILYSIQFINIVQVCSKLKNNVVNTFVFPFHYPKYELKILTT